MGLRSKTVPLWLALICVIVGISGMAYTVYAAAAGPNYVIQLPTTGLFSTTSAIPMQWHRGPIVDNRITTMSVVLENAGTYTVTVYLKNAAPTEIAAGTITGTIAANGTIIVPLTWSGTFTVNDLNSGVYQVDVS